MEQDPASIILAPYYRTLGGAVFKRTSAKFALHKAWDGNDFKIFEYGYSEFATELGVFTLSTIYTSSSKFIPDEPVYCSFCRKRLQPGWKVVTAMGKLWCFSCQNKRQELRADKPGSCGRCGEPYAKGDLIGFMPWSGIWCIFCTKGRDPGLRKLTDEQRKELEEAVRRVRLLENIAGRSPEAEQELQEKLGVLLEYKTVKEARDLLKKHGRL